MTSQSRAVPVRLTPPAPTLRSTPLRFRILFGLGAILVVAGYLLVLTGPGGPTLAALIHQPGFLLLAGLVLLADLYPLVPSMRDVRSNMVFAWSAAISLAAVLAYGPKATLLFVVSGMTAALSRRTERWWHVVLNMIIFGLIGLPVAVLARGAQKVDPLMSPGAWRLAAWGLVMAAVVVLFYTLLTGLALTQLGASNWAKQWARFGKNVRIWGVSLITAPLLAALALQGPWALPAMAVVIVSLNHLSSIMFRSTAASRTDGLTGLANRLTLTRRLSARIAELEPGRSVTLMLIDLNRFKDVNDSYGHLVGDEVLIVVAHRLLAAAAPTDLVSRYGGDEFAVVVGPGTNPEQVAATRHAFRATLDDPVTVGLVSVVVGGSVGVARTMNPDLDVLDLVERADRDMYRAKRLQERAAPGSWRPGPAAGPRPARRRGAPVWSTTVQGASAAPAAGWPGVYLSWSPGSGPSGGPAVWGSAPVEGGVR